MVPLRRSNPEGRHVRLTRELCTHGASQEEVNNIMTANYATNVQRVKAIIMQSKVRARHRRAPS